MWNKLWEGHINIYIYNRMMRQYLKKTILFTNDLYKQTREVFIFTSIIMWNKLWEGHIDIYIYNIMMRQYRSIVFIG